MMIKIGYPEMYELIKKGCTAFDYARDHYEELNARPTVHELFGPPSHGLGALAAGHLTPPKERLLKRKTRRKKYVIYELDEAFRVIRIKHIGKEGKVQCTYHLFELDGIVYARAFLGETNRFYTHKTHAIKYSGGQPLYYAQTSPNYLCIDLYEYPCSNRVKTTCYLFLPASKNTAAGVPVCWEAPLGSNNSPVTLDYFEEEYHYLDFEKLCME